VNRWSCKAEQLDRSLRFGERSEVWEITGLPEALQRAQLTVPVRSLRCGNRVMERDLYRTVQAHNHPVMTFRLYTYEFLSPSSGNAFTVRTVGALGLAGREQVIRVDARVERLPGGLLRLRGRKALRMTDFGIEPPSAMFGLIQAHDELAVRFDLVFDPRAIVPAVSDNH
jgi:hypothetical protein